jgi:predicted ATP-binding protein involved in virulence
MYIKKIELKNFRGFRELSLETPKDLVVFIGINGSGKSSILDAISVLLDIFIYKIANPEGKKIKSTINKTISNRDIYARSREGEMTHLSISVFDELSLTDTENNLELKLSFEIRPSRVLSSQINIYYERKALDQYCNLITKNLADNQTFSLPIIVYYHSVRTTHYHNTLKRNQKNNRKELYRIDNFPIDVYEQGLGKAMFDFHIFGEWFRWQEDYENEKRLREDMNYKNEQLEVVRKAIEKFFNTFPHANFSNLRMVRTPYRDDFTFTPDLIGSALTISKGDYDFNLEELSDGERLCLLIVADIARRLAIANPALGVHALEKGRGIVLIDEIESHLHPEWQREIVPTLQKTFPNCQFIITTHSPQILSNIPRENVFILEDGNIVKLTPHTLGRDSNSILYELMGVTKRPEPYQKQLDRCFDLIDEGKMNEAKQALQKLAESWGENDSEIVRATTLMSFLNEIEPGD